MCAVSTVTEPRPTIARNIESARNAKGYSKRQAAKEADVYEWQLRSWEAGRIEPSAHSLLKLVPVLGHRLDWFYEDHDDDGAPDG